MANIMVDRQVNNKRAYLYKMAFNFIIILLNAGVVVFIFRLVKFRIREIVDFLL